MKLTALFTMMLLSIEVLGAVYPPSLILEADVEIDKADLWMEGKIVADGKTYGSGWLSISEGECSFDNEKIGQIQAKALIHGLSIRLNETVMVEDFYGDLYLDCPNLHINGSIRVVNIR